MRSDKKTVDDAKAEITRRRAEYKKINAEYEAKSKTANAAANYIKEMLFYVGGLTSPVAECGTRPSDVSKKAHPQMLIDGIRKQIDEQRELIKKAEEAPIKSAAAKRIMRDYVEGLARFGTPDVAPLVDGAGIIVLPIINGLRHHLRVTSGAHPARDDVHVDPLAFFAWAFKDALVSAFEREIDETSDDASALTDEQRAAKILAAKKEILYRERVEEAVIESAHADGLKIERRWNTDFRAVLCLSDTAPDPAIMRA